MLITLGPNISERRRKRGILVMRFERVSNRPFQSDYIYIWWKIWKILVGMIRTYMWLSLKINTRIVLFESFINYSRIYREGKGGLYPFFSTPCQGGGQGAGISVPTSDPPQKKNKFICRHTMHHGVGGVRIVLGTVFVFPVVLAP